MPEHPPPEEEALPPGQLYRLAWVFYLLLALGGVLWVGTREGSIGLGLFLAQDWWIDLGAGLLAGGALLGLWWLAERLSSDARALTDLLRRRLGPIEPGEAVGLAVLSGFAEEFFFRGAVQGSWGWFWATVLFAVLHSGRSRELRLWGGFALLAGALFGGLVVWRGVLLGPIVAHVTVNGVSLLRIAGLGDPERAREREAGDRDLGDGRAEPSTEPSTEEGAEEAADD